MVFAEKGLSQRLRDHWLKGDFLLVTSEALLRELERVLHYPRILKRFAPTEARLTEFLSLLKHSALVTTDTFQVDRIQEDPADNRVLACALEGQAHAIVSRDPHLRNLKTFHAIPILGLTEFLALLEKKSR